MPFQVKGKWHKVKGKWHKAKGKWHMAKGKGHKAKGKWHIRPKAKIKWQQKEKLSLILYSFLFEPLVADSWKLEIKGDLN